mmetsp:Transcript_7886/g.16926  ORF Transcript_7886/g.16926 Transcript_7886/m.16926 type:complete len:230 (+) Transcript_7886:638-1327(+)
MVLSHLFHPLTKLWIVTARLGNATVSVNNLKFEQLVIPIFPAFYIGILLQFPFKADRVELADAFGIHHVFCFSNIRQIRCRYCCGLGTVAMAFPGCRRCGLGLFGLFLGLVIKLLCLLLRTGQFNSVEALINSHRILVSLALSLAPTRECSILLVGDMEMSMVSFIGQKFLESLFPLRRLHSPQLKLKTDGFEGFHPFRGQEFALGEIGVAVFCNSSRIRNNSLFYGVS